MTEAEWLACSAPGPLLNFLREQASDRKLRLFAVACCRRVEHCLVDRRSQNNVEVNERFADGLAERSELELAWRAADHALESLAEHGNSIAQRDAAIAAARLDVVLHATGNVTTVAALTASVAVARARGAVYESTQLTPGASRAARRAAEEAAFQAAQSQEWQTQAAFLRCLFGNPFRPVTVDPAWLSSNVRSIAQGIYENRAFDRLPILGDALEDAGCTNVDILNHCRQPGEHGRGCWTVDLLLGKK